MLLNVFTNCYKKRKSAICTKFVTTQLEYFDHSKQFQRVLKVPGKAVVLCEELPPPPFFFFCLPANSGTRAWKWGPWIACQRWRVPSLGSYFLGGLVTTTGVAKGRGAHRRVKTVRDWPKPLLMCKEHKLKKSPYRRRGTLPPTLAQSPLSLALLSTSLKNPWHSMGHRPPVPTYVLVNWL